MIPNFDNGGGSTGGGSGLPTVRISRPESDTIPPVFDPKQRNPTEGMNGLETFFYNVGKSLKNVSNTINNPEIISNRINNNPLLPGYNNPNSTSPSSNPLVDPNSPMQASGMYAGTLEYYLSTGRTNSIPASMADSMGMTEVLSQPSSGWSMSSYGNWVYDASGANSQTPNIVGVQNINGQILLKTDTGQRLDQAGNVVWDPATATTDVYGGQFVSGNEKRFERDKYGVLRRVEWKNGRKQLRRGGGGGGNNQTQPQPRTEQAQFTGSYGVVNFNTGSG